MGGKHLFLAGQYWWGVLPETNSGTGTSKYKMIGTWDFKHLFLGGQYWWDVLPVTESGTGIFYLTLVNTF